MLMSGIFKPFILTFFIEINYMTCISYSILKIDIILIFPRPYYIDTRQHNKHGRPMDQ